MRKALLAIVLATLSASAAAEVWVVVGKNEKFDAYADPASMRKDGGTVKMWNLFDYKTAQPGVGGKRYLSAKHHREYDCKAGRARVLAVTSHAENLAKGEVIAAVSVNLDWSVVASGSADELLWKFACGK
jgi:hypothetical protein